MDVFKFVPIAVSPVMMTIAISPAIKAYSIAVAPVSFFANVLKISNMKNGS